MIGSRRFLERLWRLAHSPKEQTPEEVQRELHRTIKKVGDDIEQFKFNTAISQLMILLNTAEKHGMAHPELMQFVQLVAPFAPYMSEELFSMIGGTESVHVSSWPVCDEAQLVEHVQTIGVQINGKARTTVSVATEATEDEVRTEAEKAAAKWLTDAEVVKFIYVPGRIANFVVKPR